jgi:hypothetical protein
MWRKDKEGKERNHMEYTHGIYICTPICLKRIWESGDLVGTRTITNTYPPPPYHTLFEKENKTKTNIKKKRKEKKKRESGKSCTWR